MGKTCVPYISDYTGLVAGDLFLCFYDSTVCQIQDLFVCFCYQKYACLYFIPIELTFIVITSKIFNSKYIIKLSKSSLLFILVLNNNYA